MRRYIAPRIVRSAENQPQAHLSLPSALIALLITHASWFIAHLLCAVPGSRAPNIRLDKALRVLGLHLHATRPLHTHSLTHTLVLTTTTTTTPPPVPPLIAIALSPTTVGYIAAIPIPLSRRMGMP